jgi:hypothetical protein
MFCTTRFALNTKVCEAIVSIYSIVASPMSASSQNGVIGVSDFSRVRKARQALMLTDVPDASMP